VDNVLRDFKLDRMAPDIIGEMEKENRRKYYYYKIEDKTVDNYKVNDF
jgi:hypothetical protein